MCRLFGFRSTILSQVHSSLVAADNALMAQSPDHPDGWGVAYYVANSPHLIKSVTPAVDDHLFQKVSGVVSSQTVIAHLRKATLGKLNVLNTHPFQYGHWTFAHNGNIKNFAETKQDIVNLIEPQLRRFILGDTDSEICFFLILTELKKEADLESQNITTESLSKACKRAVDKIITIAGDLHEDDDGPPHESYLSFIISNGRVLIGHQGGKHLYYSTHKLKCSEREVCPCFAPICEKEARAGERVNHLIFSSESLENENIWIPMSFRQMIGVDESMQLTIF